MEARPEQVSYDANGRLLTRPNRARRRRARGAAGGGAARDDAGRHRSVGRRSPTCSTARRRPHFVAEVDDDGRAILRFGDGEYGARLSDAVSLRAVYRVGNGRAGNVGAEAIAHAAPLLAAPWIVRLRNPLAASGGADPETIEEVRQLAPQAFHAELFRAVTEADWAEAAAEAPRRPGRGGHVPLDRQLVHGLRRRRSRRPRRPRRPARTAARACSRPSRSASARSSTASASPATTSSCGRRASCRSSSSSRSAPRRATSAPTSPRPSAVRSRHHVLPRRHARLLPPVELHVRPAGLPQPHLRRGRARRGRRVGGGQALPALRPGRSGRARARRPADRRPGRSRGSTTTRTSSSTAS